MDADAPQSTRTIQTEEKSPNSIPKHRPFQHSNPSNSKTASTRSHSSLYPSSNPSSSRSPRARKEKREKKKQSENRGSNEALRQRSQPAGPGRPIRGGFVGAILGGAVLGGGRVLGFVLHLDVLRATYGRKKKEEERWVSGISTAKIQRGGGAISNVPRP
jgi:hypothetical protein